MANEKEPETPETPETPTPETPAPETPSVTYVTADEFKRTNELLTGTLEAVKESLQALSRNNAPTPIAPSAIDEASDEEIEHALANGTGAKTFRKLVSAEVAKLDRKYDARASQLENTAGGSLANMAMQMAKPLMKHYTKPYVKKDVDAYISQMPNAQKLAPENYMVVYNAVIGQHMDAIIAEEVEASKRQQRNAAPAPGSANGRSNESPTQPNVKEVFGEEAERALRGMGNRSLESIAKAFGMSVEDYIKLAQNEGEGNVH